MTKKTQYPLTIVGAGPAGLMAASSALEEGVRPLILEASSEAGLKLLLTGGGRCNISNLESDPDIGDQYHGQANFLRPAMRVFSPDLLKDYFNSRGVPLVLEDNVKLYPAQGGAVAVRQVFLDELRKSNVQIRYRERVLDVISKPDGFEIRSTLGTYFSKKVVLATGGASFPQTGSDGSALEICRSMGVSIRPFTPALSSLILQSPETKAWSGITLPACRISLIDPESKNVRVYEDGDILLTSFGLSGPPVLNLSRYFPEHGLTHAELDFLPLLNQEESESAIRKQAEDHPKKTLKNIDWPALPIRLREPVLKIAGIDPESTAAHLSLRDLRALNRVLRHFPLKVKGVRGMNTAYLCRGGVLTSEINPRDLSLLKYPDLHVCGELIDIDGNCGGFSLQLAFATGFLAGRQVAKSLLEDNLHNS